MAVDVNGVVIGLGDHVKQEGVSDPNKGALARNALCEGVVVGLGRSRAEVYFGEHRPVTHERITRMVAGQYLRIVPDEERTRRF